MRNTGRTKVKLMLFHRKTTDGVEAPLNLLVMTIDGVESHHLKAFFQNSRK
jgi:hypothetical protein